MTAIGSQEAIQLARETVDAFGAADWDRLRALLAPDAVWEQICTQERIEGPDGIVDLNRRWKQAFPDARGDIMTAVGVEDAALLEVTFSGRQDGPLESPQGAIPPSGKQATVRAAIVVEVRDGRITQVREYFDLWTILGQIGALSQA
jgi:steroid delta-isomerase-like uncharacterized protein